MSRNMHNKSLTLAIKLASIGFKSCNKALRCVYMTCQNVRELISITYITWYARSSFICYMNFILHSTRTKTAFISPESINGLHPISCDNICYDNNKFWRWYLSTIRKSCSFLIQIDKNLVFSSWYNSIILQNSILS